MQTLSGVGRKFFRVWGAVFIIHVSLPSVQCSSGRKWELLTESSTMTLVQMKGQEGVVSLKKDILGARAGALSQLG